MYKLCTHMCVRVACFRPLYGSIKLGRFGNKCLYPLSHLASPVTDLALGAERKQTGIRDKVYLFPKDLLS